MSCWRNFPTLTMLIIYAAAVCGFFTVAAVE